ncbi:MAG: response regulator [Gemmatimonadales bacterium]|nr:response regulator [Gemmatimonadales bacterium]NIN12792.1 response regulator [Gemmatimonadales bacterium]NIN48720.1 response regulator [Gemmatimonadales bacterium]NIP06184.1 response regulator [Gemmatimonadales bacterium]NIR01369.1 response regulator [Gemmatimonadales bacterium]
MALRPATGLPVVVLIVDEQDSTARALDSVLSPEGFTVTRAYTAKHGLEQIRARPPDILIISRDLPDGSGVDLCRALATDEQLEADVPILVTGAGPPTRGQRLAALKAGAWDLIGFPIDAMELVRKLHNYVRAKSAADRMRRESLVDLATGLYSAHGLRRRAAELCALARRHRSPLACIVVAPVRCEDDCEGMAAAVRTLAVALKDAGRRSDAIGRLGEVEFAILAPDTDADGATQLAERLRQAVITRQALARTSFKIRGGYEVVSKIREAPSEAEQLVLRASQAMRRAMTAPNTEDWIQPFGETKLH